MFLICRKNDGPISVMARGDCEDFVKHYFKYNIGDRDIDNCEVLETKVLDINQFLEKKPDVPLSKGSAEAETLK
jgi:hypothetical protein